MKVVGVERRDADPSQIGWYRDRELSTVDNVDETAGRAALVFVLAGADGAFGRRDGAQDLLPPVVATAPRPVTPQCRRRAGRAAAFADCGLRCARAVSVRSRR